MLTLNNVCSRVSESIFSASFTETHRSFANSANVIDVILFLLDSKIFVFTSVALGLCYIFITLLSYPDQDPKSETFKIYPEEASEEVNDEIEMAVIPVAQDKLDNQMILINSAIIIQNQQSLLKLYHQLYPQLKSTAFLHHPQSETNSLKFLLTFTDRKPKIKFPRNHSRISLIECNENERPKEEAIKQDIQCPQEPREHNFESQKTFEYFLKWNLSMEELEKLTYAEKSRRFYHLEKHGEAKMYQDPPEEQFKDVQISSGKQEQPPEFDTNEYAHFDQEPLTNQTEFIINTCGKVLLDEDPNDAAINKKPLNILSELVKLANNIDISSIQMNLLKMNSLLTCSLLKETYSKRFKINLTEILKLSFNPSSTSNIKYNFKESIKYKMLLLAKSNAYIYNKQLRNI